MKTIGFDFMCEGQQHHTYHIGAMVNGYIDELHLNCSCEFTSPIANKLNAKSIYYHPKFKLYIRFLKLFLARETISILGINSAKLMWLVPITPFGRRLEIHVHGQIAGIRRPLKKIIWLIYSIFFEIVVGNPIFLGPRFIKPIGNVGEFVYLQKDKKLKPLCVLYGANKSFLNDPTVIERIERAGFPVRKSVNPDGYVSTSEIVESLSIGTHTFMSLDFEHYLLSPSGRVCDLTIYDLQPIVLMEDLGTKKILDMYQRKFIEV